MYLQHRARLKTGDLILFSGRDGFSEVIKKVTGSIFSHVGMVIWDNTGWLGDRVYLTESTTLVDLPDAISHEFIKGVQIQFLSDRLWSYDGQAYLLPLKTGIDPVAKVRMLDQIKIVHAAKTPYDFDQAMGAGFGYWMDLFDNRRDFSKLFCSEWITRLLETGNKVPLDVNPSAIIPAQMTRFDCFAGSPVLIKNEFIREVA